MGTRLLGDLPRSRDYSPTVLDGYTKHRQDRLWDRVAAKLVPLGLTANQWTWIGALLLILQAGAYLWHKNPFVLLVGIASTELLDDVDGAVARVTGTTSHDGAYLDAMTDRYKDAALLAALAHVHDAWRPAYFALWGSVVTSYAKARAGMEVPISNGRWPDLFERFERIVFVCLLLLVYTFVRRDGVIQWGMWILAALAQISAAQRFLRARRILRAHDDAGSETRGQVQG